MIQRLITTFSKNPQKLFLIDALGAFVSGISIFVLSQFNLGISTQNLIILITLAISLSIYSTTCFLSLRKNHIEFIRILTIGNLIYCLLTIGILMVHFNQLTTISWLYFPLELIIISFLIAFELKIARAIEKS